VKNLDPIIVATCGNVVRTTGTRTKRAVKLGCVSVSSQYWEYLEDPLTYFAYPVFDSFGDDRQLAGVLATNVYWKLFFTDILPPSAPGIVCILENSHNQTLAFLILGKRISTILDMITVAGRIGRY
jgi:hypothetical protein